MAWFVSSACDFYLFLPCLQAVTGGFIKENPFRSVIGRHLGFLKRALPITARKQANLFPVILGHPRWPISKMPLVGPSLLTVEVKSSDPQDSANDQKSLSPVDLRFDLEQIATETNSSKIVSIGLQKNHIKNHMKSIWCNTLKI